jgi:hypothetical protein
LTMCIKTGILQTSSFTGFTGGHIFVSVHVGGHHGR